MTRLFAKEGRVAESTQILAWSVKACVSYYPPKLYEDVLLMVRWKEPKDTWSLLHLTRVPDGQDHYYKEWTNGSGPPTSAVKWNADFPAEPTEADAIRFVRTTRFGNNETDVYRPVLRVFAYKIEWRELLKELEKGIDSNEKGRRHDAGAWRGGRGG